MLKAQSGRGATEGDEAVRWYVKGPLTSQLSISYSRVRLRAHWSCLNAAPVPEGARRLPRSSTRCCMLLLFAGVARLIRTFLFGVAPWDPAAVVGAVLVLLAIATLASWIPARRAGQVDPAEALRAD